jgi:hypothetical protein
MKQFWRTYLLLISVFVGSILFGLFMPVKDIIKQWAGVTGELALMGGLISALFQLARDEARYQKDLFLQHEQQLFDLGATSHMANVAFDKHAQFCEEYYIEVRKAIATLIQEGYSPKMLDHARQLVQIQHSYFVWLTPTIQNGLASFEHALRTIGANAETYQMSPEEANKRGFVQEAYRLLSDILEYKKKPGETADETIAVTKVLTLLREFLGIEDLTTLRQRLIAGVSGAPKTDHVIKEKS